MGEGAQSPGLSCGGTLQLSPQPQGWPRRALLILDPLSETSPVLGTTIAQEEHPTKGRSHVAGLEAGSC